MLRVHELFRLVILEAFLDGVERDLVVLDIVMSSSIVLTRKTKWKCSLSTSE